MKHIAFRQLNRLAMIGVMAALLGSAATAQTAYTVTILAPPADAVAYFPSLLDKQGGVVGGMFYKGPTQLSVPLWGGCLWCPTYQVRPVSWSAEASASVVAVLGKPNLFPLASNDKGTLLGPYRSKFSQVPPYFPPTGWPTGDAQTGWDLGLISLDTATRQGRVDKVVAQELHGKGKPLKANGLNNRDWLLGVTTRPPFPGVSYALYVADVVRGGVASLLELGDFQGSSASGINDAGMVVGAVDKHSPDTGNGSNFLYSRPAIWVNDQLTWVGDESLQYMDATNVNASGQVLLNGGAGKTPQAALWDHGIVTPIAVGAVGELVMATALNDQGTVVGCTKGALDGDPFLPFIWKNGLKMDLTQELANKGVTPPVGMVWACPLAINNSGAILTHYWDGTGKTPSTWVRLNPKP